MIVHVVALSVPYEGFREVIGAYSTVELAKAAAEAHKDTNSATLGQWARLKYPEYRSGGKWGAELGDYERSTWIIIPIEVDA